VQSPEAAGFLNFEARKWLKIDAENAKNNIVNLYCNFSSAIFKEKFEQKGPCPLPS